MSSSEVPVPQVLPVPGQPPSSTVQHLSLSSQGGRWLQPTGQEWAPGRLGHTLGPQQSLRHEPNPDHLVLWTKSNPSPAGSAQGMETVRKHRLSAGLSQVGGSGGDEASAQARLLRGLLLPSGSPGRSPHSLRPPAHTWGSRGGGSTEGRGRVCRTPGPRAAIAMAEAWLLHRGLAAAQGSDPRGAWLCRAALASARPKGQTGLPPLLHPSSFCSN